jgi:hypothetical protein
MSAARQRSAYQLQDAIAWASCLNHAGCVVNTSGVFSFFFCGQVCSPWHLTKSPALRKYFAAVLALSLAPAQSFTATLRVQHGPYEYREHDIMLNLGPQQAAVLAPRPTPYPAQY